MNIHDTFCDSGHCCWKIPKVFQDAGCVFEWICSDDLQTVHCTVFSSFAHFCIDGMHIYLHFTIKTSTIHVGKYTVRLMDGMGKHHKLQLQRSVQTPIDFRQTGPAVGSGPVVPERITSSRSSERRILGVEKQWSLHGTPPFSSWWFQLS